jgi:hypothetical protein
MRTERAADAGRKNSKNMTKCQKQKAKLRLKLVRADLAQCPIFLSPGDIPRARLFLCHHSDVQDDAQLPPLRMEIDPLRPLAQSIAQFEAKFQSVPPPGRASEKAQLRPVPSHGNSAKQSDRPFAIFYGSGQDFSQCHVPDDLQWSVTSLAVGMQSGCVPVLDVVTAIKNAMPLSWLAGHGMAEDCLSVAFSKSQQEILDVYAAALHAWGAEDVLQPVVHLEDVLRPAVDDEARHGSAAAWQVIHDATFHVFRFSTTGIWQKLFSHTHCSGKMIASGSRTSQCTFNRLKEHIVSSSATQVAPHKHALKSAVEWALSTISSILLHQLLLLNLSGTHRKDFQCVQLLELK